MILHKMFIIVNAFHMAFLGKGVPTNDVRFILHKNWPALTAKSVMSHDDAVPV